MIIIEQLHCSLFLVIYFATIQLHTCPGSCRSCGLSVMAIWSHVGKSIVRPCFFFKPLFSAFMLFLHFCFPPTTPPFCFPLFTVITVRPVPGCPFVGAYGWIARIAGHGSVLLSRGWLITVEAPEHPGTHLRLSSIQLLIHDIQS